MSQQNVVSPVVIGARVQRYRLLRQLTQQQLADGAGISLTTLQKLEAGCRVRESTLEKLCEYVREFAWDFRLPIEDWDKRYRVHQPENLAWLVAFNTKKSPGMYKDGVPLYDDAERDRLGRLGFVTSFNHRFECDLRDGRIRVSILELYADMERVFTHPEEEYVYCLRGDVRVTVEAESVDLRTGQCMTFWSDRPHTYGLARPLEPDELPPQLLMVTYDGRAIQNENVPPEKRPKRRPRRPKHIFEAKPAE